MAIDRGFNAKLRYRVDEFIGGGAGKQLAFLAILTFSIIGVFTLIGLVLGLGGTEGGIFDRLYETAWFYFGRVIDAGTFVGDEGIVNRSVSTVV